MVELIWEYMEDFMWSDFEEWFAEFDPEADTYEFVEYVKDLQDIEIKSLKFVFNITYNNDNGDDYVYLERCVCKGIWIDGKRVHDDRVIRLFESRVEDYVPTCNQLPDYNAINFDNNYSEKFLN